MDTHDLEHLRKLQKAHQDRLNALELQAARFGLSVPVHITVEINEIKAIIASLNDRLDASGSLSPLQKNKKQPDVADSEIRQSLIRLRDILSTLYETENKTRRVIYDAGLSESNIDFRGAATEIWHEILKEAQKHARIKQLLSIAMTEYPDNAELKRCWYLYQT